MPSFRFCIPSNTHLFSGAGKPKNENIVKNTLDYLPKKVKTGPILLT